MTPTKASLAKSFPHLLAAPVSTLPRDRTLSPAKPRRQTRSSIPPEGLTEVVEVNGRHSLSKEDARVTLGKETSAGTTVQGQKSTTENQTVQGNEDDLERGLMRRVRILRAECDGLEQQIENAKQMEDNRPRDIDVMIQLLLRTNDSALATVAPELEVKSSLPTAAPKELRNPIPLLRFVHPLTFYSTSSRLVPLDGEIIRHLSLKGYILERYLYFTISLAISRDQITSLELKCSPWAHPELTALITRYISPRFY